MPCTRSSQPSGAEQSERGDSRVVGQAAAGTGRATGV